MTTKPKLLSRDDILAVDDRVTEVVPVPEWGGAVTVRALSGNQRDKYQNDMLRYGRNERGGIEITAVDADMHTELDGSDRGLERPECVERVAHPPGRGAGPSGVGVAVEEEE